MNKTTTMLWEILVCSILMILSEACAVPNDKPAKSDGSPIRTEKLCDYATRLVYEDGSEKWLVVDREGNQRDLKLVPPPAPTRPEPRPRAEDSRRGYIIFSPTGREGVLPDYRPSKVEIAESASIFASPGESEPATFAIRPVRDLGMVEFSCGRLLRAGGSSIPSSNIDVYIVEPTVEQIGLSGETIHWAAKWLRPASTARMSVAKNTQVYLDIHVPANTVPGKYEGKVLIKPRLGKPSYFILGLEVLPLKLERPMPWGFFNYMGDVSNWREYIGFVWKELRLAGMTQLVIHPSDLQSPPVASDGTLDFTAYDEWIRLYREAGFPDPPVLDMERLMLNVCIAMGKAQQLQFDDTQSFAGRAEDVPLDVRERVGGAIRRIYQHSLDAKWPRFYVYFADEPSTISARSERVLEMARFMYGLTREVAPAMRTASTVYDLQCLKGLDKLLDLNIASYNVPCESKEADSRWRALARDREVKLYGINWITGEDTYWSARRFALLAEKGGLDGMMPWTQWAYEDMKDPFSPYRFLRQPWKGGPWFMGELAGGTGVDWRPPHKLWRSLQWIGLRESIDDSRYVHTLRAAISRAEVEGNRTAAKVASKRLMGILNKVPWANSSKKSCEWNAVDCDGARRQLAEATIACLGSSGSRKQSGNAE